jgi:hypothetical protein
MTWSPRLYAPTVSHHGHALAVGAAVVAAVGAILVFGLTIDAQTPADVVLQSSNSRAIAISPVGSAPGTVAGPSLAAEAATPAPPTSAGSTEPTQQRPVFDILRLEPGGAAVIAGHASANAALELRADGRVVAQANANHLGDFTMSPPPFETGPHRLELAARSGVSPTVFSDPVAIDVPTREAKDAAAAPQAAPAAAGSADASSSEASQSNSPGANVASASLADGVTVVLRTPTPPPRPKFARLPTKYPEARPVKGGKTNVALLPSPAVDPSYEHGGHTTK